MVQGGHIHKVGGALKVLTEQAVRPEQGGTAHAAPSPELAPHSTSDSQAWITRHTNHLYPVGLVMLADVAVTWLNLPIPVAKYKLKAEMIHGMDTHANMLAFLSFFSLSHAYMVAWLNKGLASLAGMFNLHCQGDSERHESMKHQLGEQLHTTQ